MEQINRHKDADPFERLKVLRYYMAYKIDRWPKEVMRFSQYVNQKHPHILPGKPEYYRDRATNCFYCRERISPGTGSGLEPKRATIDHWVPKSKDKTEKYVICCAECNTKKADVMPDVLRSQIMRAINRGQRMFGYPARKLGKVGEAVNTITNDIIYNTGPRVYYIQFVKPPKQQHEPKR